MYKTKNVAIFALVLSSLLVAFSGSHPTTASGGYTTAPGDGACAQCHTSNNTALDGDYTITGVPSTIEANTTYTVEVQLTNPSGNASRGGFQILALDDANTQGGSWSNASTGSSLKTAAGKTYLGHQGSQSFPANNELNWTADWTSPNEDDVTFDFYAVSIIADGSGNQNDRFIVQQFDATIPQSATPLTLSIVLVSDATCANSTNGSATVTITGGVAPYDILWENGETTATATMLPVGNTFVTVTDATNASTEVEIDIDFLMTLQLNLDELNNVTCFGTSNGDAMVSVPNGTAPINFDWSNGDNGSSINNLSGGTYTVIATDANGCDATLDITITEPQDFLIIPTMNMPSCNGNSDGFINLNVIGGTTPYFYMWEDGSQDATNSNLAAGIYLTTISDSNGCTTEVSTEVTEPSALDISTQNQQDPICTGDSNGSITVTPAGGTPGYQYNWSIGSTAQTISNLIAGEYLLTVTDSENCSQTATYFLTEQIEIIISTSSTTESTPGASDGTATAAVVSGGNAPYQYQWSNGDLTATINNLTSGTYSVTVVDANGCFTEGQTIVSSGNCALSLEVATIPVTCFGDGNGSATVTIVNGIAPITYLWSDGSDVGTRSDLAPGNYTLIVEDNAGCSDMMMDIIITEPSELNVQINIIASNACGGENSGELSAIVTGGTLDYMYAWNNGDDAAITSGLPNGDYSVTVTDANGCTAEASSSITSIDNVAPIIMLQNLIHYADSNGFSDIPASVFDNGSMDNCSDVTLEYLDIPLFGCEFLGTQEISIVGSDILGNTDTMNVMLTLIDTLAPIILDGQIDLIELEGCEPFMFDLPSFSDNCSDNITVEQLAGLESGQIFPVGSTNQIYFITDMSGNGLTYSFTVNVTSDLSSSISSTDVSCFGGSDGSISVELSGIHAPFVQDSSIVSNDLTAGGYLITIQDTVGCQMIEIVNIAEPAELDADVIAIPASTNNSTDGEVTITITGGTQPYNIRLFDALGDLVAMNSNGEFGDLLSGTYNVLVVDENGCEISISEIEVAFVTSTIDLFGNYNIKSYPNPVLDELTIWIQELSATLDVSIRSLDGKVVWSDKGRSGIISIDLTDHANGLYMLSVTDQKSTSTRKISLQH